MSSNLKVGDLVHVVTGKKQTGTIEVIDLDKQEAKVYWGFMDNQRVITTHPLADLYKSDYKPPPAKDEVLKRPDVESAPLGPGVPSEADTRTGYGDRAH